MKNKIYSWCKYWHFNITGVLTNNEKHSNYLNVVDTLDYWFDTDSWDSLNLEESWSIIKNNINKCSEDDIKELNRLIKL